MTTHQDNGNGGARNARPYALPSTWFGPSNARTLTDADLLNSEDREDPNATD